MGKRKRKVELKEEESGVRGREEGVRGRGKLVQRKRKFGLEE